MKKIIISLFICAAALIASSADNVKVVLGWNPSCGQSVTGYKVYYGSTNVDLSRTNYTTRLDCASTNIFKEYFFSSNFSQVTNVGNVTTTTISNLQCSTYYFFAVTAYDPIGNESGFSGQAWFRTPNAYTNGGQPPNQNFVVSSYTTNWFAQPLIQTNEVTGQVYTNYYSLSVRTFKLKSDLYVRTNWVILVNTNLAKTNWTVFAYGSNSIPFATITNVGGAAFFRIRL
jgi:hypothetical protein